MTVFVIGYKNDFDLIALNLLVICDYVTSILC